MKWTDSLDIAIELSEAHPEIDPRTIRFTDLHRWVMELPEELDEIITDGITKDEAEEKNMRIMTSAERYGMKKGLAIPHKIERAAGAGPTIIRAAFA